MSERSETVVIGAGQAGLATSYWLTQRGLEHVVLERGRVGETWRSQRWDGFCLNTPNWGQQLPGFHYAGSEPDAFAPRDETIAYLEDYARSFGAPVREGADVTRVRRSADGFELDTTQGTIACDQVVVAAGAFQRPAAHRFANRLPADVFQLHTSEYKLPPQLPDGAVLIVGSGQSGCQIADELIDAGRTVYLSVGRCPWFPRRYRGRELLHWLLETGLADDPVESLPSPAARLARATRRSRATTAVTTAIPAGWRGAAQVSWDGSRTSTDERSRSATVCWTRSRPGTRSSRTSRGASTS